MHFLWRIPGKRGDGDFQSLKHNRSKYGYHQYAVILIHTDQYWQDNARGSTAIQILRGAIIRLIQGAKRLLHWGKFGQRRLGSPAGASVTHCWGKRHDKNIGGLLWLLQLETRPLLFWHNLWGTAWCHMCGQHITVAFKTAKSVWVTCTQWHT